MEGIAILLFIIGVMFIALEACIPGFGVPGIIGFVCCGISSVMLTNFYGIVGLIVAVGVACILAFIIFKIFKARGIGKRIVLNDALEAQAYNDVDYAEMLDKKGLTLSSMRPFGKIEIDGNIVNAISDSGEFIPKGVFVRVVRTEAYEVRVVKNKED